MAQNFEKKNKSSPSLLVFSETNHHLAALRSLPDDLDGRVAPFFGGSCGGTGSPRFSSDDTISSVEPFSPPGGRFTKKRTDRFLEPKVFFGGGAGRGRDSPSELMLNLCSAVLTERRSEELLGEFLRSSISLEECEVRELKKRDF